MLERFEQRDVDFENERYGKERRRYRETRQEGFVQGAPATSQTVRVK